MELGAGVGGDEPAVRGADDVALPDGRVREARPVGLLVGEVEELSGAGAGGGGGVEEAGGLGAAVDPEATEAAQTSAARKRSGNSRSPRTVVRTSDGSLDQSAAAAVGSSIGQGSKSLTVPCFPHPSRSNAPHEQ